VVGPCSPQALVPTYALLPLCLLPCVSRTHSVTLIPSHCHTQVPLPLRRLPYAEAMAKYGSDKPDQR
jgi:hypothetical protein